MNIKRKSRLEQDIKRYLSQIILINIRDPRLDNNLAITDVKITEDMKYAKISVSFLGDEKKRNESIDILNKAKGYIRKELSGKLITRFTPELNFYLDDSVENSIRINKLLRNIHEEENK